MSSFTTVRVAENPECFGKTNSYVSLYNFLPESQKPQATLKDIEG